ncbi:tetratricopeptide repeat protein [Nonomuraea sp. NPDC026600]|uniref:tetratricopeptide repeat protein n=1 Tax=Nonomuraea sp. NPDC026600 TaxID=3155363 RepID=UPI0033D39D7F
MQHARTRPPSAGSRTLSGTRLSEPDTLHNTFTAARAYHRLERHAEAAALFEDVIPRVEIPYDAPVIAMTWGQYGASLRELGRHREAAEQFLQGAELVQNDSDQRAMHAELAWSAAEALQYSGQTTEALAAYQRTAALWTELGQLTPRVRCLRSAAWLLRYRGEPDSEEHTRPVGGPTRIGRCCALTDSSNSRNGWPWARHGGLPAGGHSPCPTRLAQSGEWLWVGYGCDSNWDGGVVRLDLTVTAPQPIMVASGISGAPLLVANRGTLVVGQVGSASHLLSMT